MLYVYAILEARGGGVAGKGLEDQPLEHEVFDGLNVVFSRHTANPTPTAGNLWRHEQVVESLMREHTLLPSRFGTMVRDRAALGDRIAPHVTELNAGLARVRGCVELGVRVLWPREQAVAPSSSSNGHATGRDYMLARLAEERRRKAIDAEAGALFDRVHHELSPLARDSTRSATSSSARPVPTAAYLVERDKIERFRRRLRELRADRANLRVLCTGPWPPYNFVPALRAASTPAEVRHG